MAAVDVVAAPGNSGSYFAHRVDDLGRSIVLHKPLDRGEYTQMSLSKVFDDPGMRPKVFNREPVNKPHSALNTSDIWGAQAKPKPKARDTNPAVPIYILPSTDATSSASNLTFSARPWSARSGRDQASAPVDAPATSTRDTISVADIEGTRPKAQCRPLSAQPLSKFSTDASDIEGSWPGWKPHHRAHVGVNLRDPGLDVSDINSYHLPISYKTLYKGQQDAEQQRALQQQQQQWQQQQQEQQRQQQQQPGLPEGFAYTGLPVFQSAPSEARGGQPEAGAPDVQVMQLVQQQQADMQRLDAEQRAAKQAQKVTHSASLGHRVRVGWAEEREAARQAANDAISQLELSRAGVEVLWNTCKAIDRQGSGRVTIAELGRALDAAGMQRSPEQMKALVMGLQDTAGLLPYRDLSKLLLAKSMQPGSDPKLFPTWSTGRARPSSARPASGSPAAKAVPASRPGSARLAQPSAASAAPGPAWAVAAAAAAAAAAPGEPAGSNQTSTAAAPASLPEPTGSNQAPTAAAPASFSEPVPAPQQQQQQQRRLQEDAVGYAGARPGPSGCAPGGAEPYPYWFGGADSPQRLQQGAADWAAKHDLTHSATAFHVREGAAAAPPAPQPQEGPRQEVSPGYASPSTSHVHEAHTTSSLLKSGKLSAAELAEQLLARSSVARSASASRARPASARCGSQGRQIFPSSGAGLSSFLTLKGTLIPVGTGCLQVGGPAARPAAGHARPASASRHMATHANASFSAVAQSRGGPNMEKLNRQMLRSEIAAVRLLF